MRRAARESADGTEFLLDGRRVATLGAGGNTDHDVGLGVLGTGTFHYDNYGFDAAGRIDGPAPGDATPKAAAAQAEPSPPEGETLPPSSDQAMPTVWIGENNQPVGPLGETTLRRRVGAGTLNRDTLVWTNDMPGWQPAASVPMIAAMLAQRPPSMPPSLPNAFERDDAAISDAAALANVERENFETIRRAEAVWHCGG